MKAYRIGKCRQGCTRKSSVLICCKARSTSDAPHSSSVIKNGRWDFGQSGFCSTESILMPHSGEYRGKAGDDARAIFHQETQIVLGSEIGGDGRCLFRPTAPRRSCPIVWSGRWRECRRRPRLLSDGRRHRGRQRRSRHRTFRLPPPDSRCLQRAPTAMRVRPAPAGPQRTNLSSGSISRP